MLTLISDEQAIRSCQGRLARRLRACANETMTVVLGYPGGGKRARVTWSAAEGIWFSVKKESGRFGNAFGVGRPDASPTARIACEINIPRGGTDRRMGGAFARDREGNIHLVHRGILGGGRRGIGKGLFTEHHRGVWAVLEDGQGQTEVSVIGCLQSARLARQVSLFVRKVDAMKAAAAMPPQLEIFRHEEPVFHPERMGMAHGEGGRRLAAECDRGLVMLDLFRALIACGVPAGNDEESPLFALAGGRRISHLFRIGGEPSAESVASGMGRLILDRARRAPPVEAVLVMPENLDPGLRETVEREGIRVLTWRWEGDRAVFPELHTLMSPVRDSESPSGPVPGPRHPGGEASVRGTE